MARVTKDEVKAVFERFVQRLGGRVATSYNDVGAYQLDHNSVYGGWVIQRVYNEHGAVESPFYHTRRSSKEFVETLWFAIALMDEQAKKETVESIS